MWVLTRYGFFSVACARRPDGRTDSDIVMLRARVRRHLLNLQERFPGTELARTEILCSAGTDYKYRVLVSKAGWASLLSELALEQTWSNFKDEAAKFARQGRMSGKYVHALHRVWETMFGLQSEEASSQHDGDNQPKKRFNGEET